MNLKFLIPAVVLAAGPFAAVAKPGEPYVLTGKETSVFGILQADIKAYQELYKGEDINAYYAAFKKVNDLDGGRKLILGEELQFPHTQKSRELQEAEAAAAAAVIAKAERKAALERKQAERERKQAERAARIEAGETLDPVEDVDPSDVSALFGSDTRGGSYTPSAEDLRKQARQRSVKSFLHSWFPGWLYSKDLSSMMEDVDELAEAAKSEVDDLFAQAIRLHRFPEKNIAIIAFEAPEKIGDYYYVAIKSEPGSAPVCYALEKGLSIFGTGELSVLVEWRSEWSTTKLGGRDYADIPSFLAEVYAGPVFHSEGS